MEVITHGASAVANELNENDADTGHNVHFDGSFFVVQVPQEDEQKAKSTQTVPTGVLPGGQEETQELLNESP